MNFLDLLYFASPAGQAALVDFVNQANAVKGKPFAEYVRENHPDHFEFVEMIVHDSPATVFEKLQKKFPLVPLERMRPQIIALHKLLKRELDKAAANAAQPAKD